jgi:hypothetical protein
MNARHAFSVDDREFFRRVAEQLLFVRAGEILDCGVARSVASAQGSARMAVSSTRQ